MKKKYLILLPLLFLLFMQPSYSSSAGTVVVMIPRGAGQPSGAPGYSPANITVVIGVNNTVMWVNNDTTYHTVTATNKAFDSGRLDPGQNFTYTFTTPGTYKYYCVYHSWMGGEVVVKQLAATTSTSSGSGGVPEFPYQAVAAAVFTALIIISYIAVRYRSQSKKQ